MSEGRIDFRALKVGIWGSDWPGTHRAIATLLIEHLPNCEPSAALLAERSGFCRETVLACLRDLETWGGVRIIRHAGRRSRYEFTNRWLRATGEPPPPATDVHRTGGCRSPAPVDVVHPKIPREDPKEDLKSKPRQMGTDELHSELPTVPPEMPKRTLPSAGSMPAVWAPSAAHRAYAAKHGLDVELEADAFRGWAEGRTQVSWDGAFRTRLANSVKWRAERASRGTGVGAGRASLGGRVRTVDEAMKEFP